MEARILLSALRRFYWLLIALVVVGAVVGGALGKSKSAEYKATASVAVSQPNLSGILNNQAQLDPAQYIATQVAVLQSNTILGPVARQSKLNLLIAEASISVGQEQGSDVVDVTATRPTAASAADLANLVTSTYLTQLKQSIQGDINAASFSLQAKISAQEAAAVGGVLSASAQTQVQQYQAELGNLSVESSVALINNQVVNTATPPASPEARHVVLKILIGAGGGLLIGIILAVIVAAWRPRMLRRSDVEDAIGLSAAAELPFVSTWRSENPDGGAQVRWARHEAFDDEMSKIAVFVEAARSYRNCKTVLVTSLEKGAGVSTVARELSATLQTGNRIVKSVPLPSLQPEDLPTPEEMYTSPRAIAAGAEAPWGGFAVPQRVAESLGPSQATRRAFVRPARTPFRESEYDADILVVDGGSLADSPSVVPLARSLDVTVFVVPLPNDNERYLNAVIRATFTDSRGQLLVVTNNNLGPRSRRSPVRE